MHVLAVCPRFRANREPIEALLGAMESRQTLALKLLRVMPHAPVFQMVVKMCDEVDHLETEFWKAR